MAEQLAGDWLQLRCCVEGCLLSTHFVRIAASGVGRPAVSGLAPVPGAGLLRMWPSAVYAAAALGVFAGRAFD